MKKWVTNHKPATIIGIAAVLLVVGVGTTAAVLLTSMQAEPATSKPASSVASSSTPDVKVKNIIIESNSESETTSSRPSAQEFKLNGDIHAGLTSNPTSKPIDIAPPANSSSPVQGHKQTASVVPVQSIETESNIKVAVGESYGINIQFTPLNATYKDITWSTSDNNIAKVDKTGMVTGIKAGSCTITVSTPNGQATAKITVTVTAEEG
jgi:uncharacterized protein YjdB